MARSFPALWSTVFLRNERDGLASGGTVGHGHVPPLLPRLVGPREKKRQSEAARRARGRAEKGILDRPRERRAAVRKPVVVCD